MEFILSIFLIGCLGGIIPDLLRFVKARFRKTALSYLSHFKYWAALILLALLGGVAAWVLGAADFKEAIIYGFAAPEIFEKLASKEKDQAVSKGAEEFMLRTWWGL